ncbi:LacI family DNA-binding transcriptional regulator [Lentilactobacillus farraginis]|uniref:Transcriptional regulator, LacI family n=2 Tax=Lentilactobacillus farraginis DSM 18382 = JCM 14108 TaxID=1423743 RepID=X0QGH3_9LACO|nr:LacI family DNA-binding transcriptional regulator [Lentilactobacillus farraginis]GAF37720.1 transcriptional regulator, LacI family [Lentilactobacillus farraginis DSM 18382 = JCM 14108]
MNYTMKDIAQRANVSVSSVSLVLNNKPSRIPKETKNKIRKIAEELNYRPNSAAVFLSKKISYNIGLIVPDITNPFFAFLTKTIDERLRASNYSTLFADSNNSFEREVQIINNMISHGVDGILLVPSNKFFYQPHNKLQEMIDNLNKPLILLNASSDLRVNSVNFDNVLGAIMATEELIKYGHKSIAFIKGKDHFVNAPERYQGYKDALKKNDILLNPNYVFEGDYTIQSGYQVAPNIFNQRDITAILSSNDLMLFGIIKWAKEHRENVFKRFSMVGFDNNPYTEIIEVPLTTIDQEIGKMADKAIDLLLTILREKVRDSKQIIIKPRIIRRNSIKSEHSR